MTDRRCKYQYCRLPLDGGKLAFCSTDHLAWRYLGTPALKLEKLRAEYEKAQQGEAKK